jgi:hypothetical protein
MAMAKAEISLEKLGLDGGNSGKGATLTPETARGHRIAATILANYATKGIGPLFSLEGKFAIYPWGPALAWAEANEPLADASWPPEAA